MVRHSETLAHEGQRWLLQCWLSCKQTEKPTWLATLGTSLLHKQSLSKIRPSASVRRSHGATWLEELKFAEQAFSHVLPGAKQGQLCHCMVLMSCTAQESAPT